MTVYGGVLLFDMAEEAINGWENQLGYRGMMEVWRKGDRIVSIEPDEDSEDPEGEHWCVWYMNDATGYAEPIDFGTFEQCDALAKEYMKTH